MLNESEKWSELIFVLNRIADEIENQTKVQSKLGHIITKAIELLGKEEERG